MSLLSELKRRNVIRMAGLYLVGAWLIVQVAGTLLPVFEAPAWVMKTLVGLMAVGFVPVLVFSWAFELTPAGLKRDADVAPEESIAPQTAHRMNRLLVAGLVLALAYFAFDKFLLGPQRARAAAEKGEKGTEAIKGGLIASVPISAKSIAVLPFENLSDDKANAYFATGMQDEILTRLAGIADLKVISRTSTEQYASHPPNLKVVAEQLGVATVLEGSVQKSEGKVRINLQLIDARTDTHLWAQKYDRELKDVFAVQSDVSEQVADALQAKLLPAESARIASVPTKNPAAYDQFLKAEYFTRQFDSNVAKDPADAVRQAANLYEAAIALDPEFALAHARLSFLKARAYWDDVGDNHKPAVIESAQAAAARALALQPDLPQAHLSMGYVHYWARRDYAAALAEFAIARAGMPNDATTVAASAYVHRRQGDLAQAALELRQAAVLDPRDTRLVRDLGDTLGYLRRYAEAETASAHSLALEPSNVESQLNLARVRKMRGDLEGSGRSLAAIPADTDPQGSVSLERFELAMAMRQPSAALAALTHATAWLTDTENNVTVPLNLLRARALAANGDATAARAAFEEALKALWALPPESRDQPAAQANLAVAFAGLGQKDDALRAARRATELLPRSKDEMDGSFYFARLAKLEAQVGETEPALEHIEELLAAPAGYEVSAASLRTDPVWDPIRKDPRFEALASGAAKLADAKP